MDQETVGAKLEVARRLLSEGKIATKAASTVGWSRATLYRYLKERGHEQPPGPEKPVALGRARLQYADVKALPDRSWALFRAPQRRVPPG